MGIRETLLKMLELYSQVMHHPYSVSWKRDTKMVKDLLESQSPEFVLSKWEGFLKLQEGWYADKKDLALFCGEFNRVVSTLEGYLPSISLDQLKTNAKNALREEHKLLRERYERTKQDAKHRQ